MRVDRKRAAARSKGFGRTGRRLSAGLESNGVVAAVAERLSLRGPASAQRGAKADVTSINAQVCSNAQRAVLADLDKVHWWRRFRSPPIVSFISNGP